MPISFWCFVCEHKFQCQDSVSECPVCHEEAFEEITQQNHPEHFQIYEKTQPIPPPPPQINPFQQNSFQVHFSFNNNPQRINLSSILGNLPRIVNQTINSLLGQLQRSGQAYARATQEEINKLEKIKNPKQCTICQQESAEEEGGYRLRCGHEFHVSCIMPWFEKANTCPTCRTKLTQQG